MSDVKFYSFEEVDLLIGGIPVGEFAAQGAGIKIGFYEQEQFISTTGVDGNVIINKNINEKGFIEFNLQQTSDANPYLSGLFLAAFNGIFTTFPVLVIDTGGGSIYTGAKCWLKSFPESTFDREVTERKWKIDVAKMIPFIGFNQLF